MSGDEKLTGSWFADYLNEFIRNHQERYYMGIFGSLKEQLALLVLPVVIGEGWAAVPEHLKAEVCVILGTCESELRAKAQTTETGIDDAAISAVYTQAKAWAAEQGHPGIMAELDVFCTVGK